MKYSIKILATILAIGLNSCCDFVCEKQKFAETIIEKVNQFKIENNRLPKNVSEIGLTELEDSPAFYKLTSDSTFIVWYGLGVGDSKVYKSKTNKWTEEG